MMMKMLYRQGDIGKLAPPPPLIGVYESNEGNKLPNFSNK